MPGRRPVSRVRRRVILLVLVLLCACSSLFSSTPAARGILLSLRPPTPMIFSAGVVGINVGPLPSAPLEWDTFIPPHFGLPNWCSRVTDHTVQNKPPVWIIFWHCSF